MQCVIFLNLFFIDLASIASGPLQIDSTHTQLSWASVSPGSSVTQTFALWNKASTRVRLLVSSPNAAFKVSAVPSIFDLVASSLSLL